MESIFKFSNCPQNVFYLLPSSPLHSGFSQGPHIAWTPQRVSPCTTEHRKAPWGGACGVKRLVVNVTCECQVCERLACEIEEPIVSITGMLALAPSVYMCNAFPIKIPTDFMGGGRIAQTDSKVRIFKSKQWPGNYWEGNKRRLVLPCGHTCYGAAGIQAASGAWGDTGTLLGKEWLWTQTQAWQELGVLLKMASQVGEGDDGVSLSKNKVAPCLTRCTKINFRWIDLLLLNDLLLKYFPL